jgi:hypothetical protein
MKNAMNPCVFALNPLRLHEPLCVCMNHFVFA